MKKIENITISENTMELINIKAQLSEVYDNICSFIAKHDAREELSYTQELKDALLNADRELMNYIASQIDENLCESKFNKL